MIPNLVFASPRKLPRASDLAGRVVVLDVAFAADGLGKGFVKTTGAFIEELGARLACWVDHHDHRRHADYANDERFVLATKAQHGACPEMITPEIVGRIGPVDTIVCHFDLDGLYSAAKWILGGKEPYAGADADARAVDTRMGEVSKRARNIDFALRAGWEDTVLNTRIVHYLIKGLPEGSELDTINLAAARYQQMANETNRLDSQYQIIEGVAVVHVPVKNPDYDKTDLLLLGQKRATVSVVVDRGNATFAAAFDSGLNFLDLFGIAGGMPTRVSLPEKRLERSLEAIRKKLQEKNAFS